MVSSDDFVRFVCFEGEIYTKRVTKDGIYNSKTKLSTSCKICFTKDNKTILITQTPNLIMNPILLYNQLGITLNI